MENKNISISLPVIEKSIDLVKGFLERLIGPSLDEVGGLLSDQVRAFRFGNQISILVKAEKMIRDRDIKIKNIPLKNLVPLLEGASLEEDETLKDKWATLLVNYADSEKNLETNVFPYILSQISIGEIKCLEILYNHVYSGKTYLSFESKKANDYTCSGLTSQLSLRSTAIIHNLIRLGLIIEDFDRELYNPEFLLDPTRPQVFPTKHLEITRLGREFLDACRLNHE